MNRYLILQKVVELGSFTRAAAVTGYSQSAVSQMIASLETELNFKILARSRTGVKLTREGKEIYPYIERTVLQYRAMKEKAGEILGLDTGVVRIGTISSVTCHWLPALIKEFQSQYPHVQFVLHQGDYASIAEWIKTGAVDFGFIAPYAADNICTINIKEGEMLAVCPKDHPLAKLKAIPLKALAKEQFILLEEGNYSEPLEAFKAAGVQPDIRYTLHDDYAIMTMIEAGLGVGILAELVLRRTHYDIVSRPVAPPIFRQLAVGFKDKDSLPIASKRFIDFLSANADKLP